MIEKILKLKKFGIFYKFAWKEELPDFKKFNLIYGWNRSGKTTISRIFSSCEKRSVGFKQYPISGEFEIKTNGNTAVKNTNVDANSLLIKVFNQDFVTDNVSFDPSNLCKPIVYVSEEDIESKERLEKLRSEKINLSREYEEAKSHKSSKEKGKDIFLSSIGREIANVIFEKGYNKTKVTNKINGIGINNFDDKKLSDEDEEKYKKINKNEAGKIQTALSKCQFSFSFGEEAIDSFQKIFKKIEELLNKKVISETLDRLKDDKYLNHWVQQGFDLHKTKEEKEKCLFCQKPLDNDFLAMLAKHFSKDYEELQSAIGDLRGEISKIRNTAIVAERKELHFDLKDNYSNKANELEECIKGINAWITEAMTQLDKKQKSPIESVVSPQAPDDFLFLYNEIIAELNKIIGEHNNRVNNHENEVSSAKEKLELHFIATALSEQDYEKMENDFLQALKREEKASEAVKKNQLDIAELVNRSSNIGVAIDKINKHLEEFFGREEIKLELSDSKEGYTIIRDGQPAINLSEGEKTAIAFSYFVAKVGEGDFDKSKGIIFIDDPISSFDSNFIYHCFSMVETYFKDVGQLFISTHNFQFFSLVKEWFANKNKRKKEGDIKAKLKSNQEKPIPCEFFMVENYIENNVRKAKIAELDKTLRLYKSEYHFLFAKLKEFSGKEDMEYEDFYTIGNMARRFFDIFADFKIPTNDNQRLKMLALIKKIRKPREEISEVEAYKAYKLMNDFSHNADPASTIEHKDKRESKVALKVLLKLIRESDPEHFEILEKTLKD